MPGRDKSSGGGRSEEDRRRDLAAREQARLTGKRPPPSFGPSTRAGRERAASSGKPAPAPRDPMPPRGPVPEGLDFDFAQPTTRAAGGPTAPAASEAPSQASGAADGPSGGSGGTATLPAPSQHGTATPTPAPAGQRPPRAPRARPSAKARARATKPAVAGAGLAGKLRAKRAGLLAVVVGVCVLIAFIALAAGGGEAPTTPAAAAKVERGPSPYGEPTDTPLPPDTRVVAYTGAPQAKELGILGTMPFERASDRLDRQAKPYERKSRPVLRAFDLIATIANADPGPGGKYRSRQTSKVIARYLRAARRHDAALILDVQPGTSNFVDEVKPLERWLKEPDVHLALDPEWRMRPGVQPGSEIGWVSAGEVTATLNRVARIVRANDLPPKLVLVHRFTDGMIKDLETVDVPKEIVGVISIDGVGTRTQKIQTYDRIAATLPKPWLPGFKVFYEEDAAAGGILYGSQVMAMRPRPHVVLYE
ncbi:MAG: hypothetical protein JHD16_03710 [Solirubrobacteraceae bacterium]|nr:hypothetical protein [Solirubrobacteraceae bacterium]